MQFTSNFQMLMSVKIHLVRTVESAQIQKGRIVAVVHRPTLAKTVILVSFVCKNTNSGTYTEIHSKTTSR